MELIETITPEIVESKLELITTCPFIPDQTSTEKAFIEANTTHASF